jgi:hypothetical protein
LNDLLYFFGRSIGIDIHIHSDLFIATGHVIL